MKRYLDPKINRLSLLILLVFLGSLVPLDAWPMESEKEVVSSPANEGESRRVEQGGDNNNAALDGSSLVQRGTLNEAGEERVDLSSQQNANAGEESDAAEFSLEDFKNALAANPTATRFIIIRDEAGNASLQPLEDEATQGKSRSQNMIVTAALRTALAVEQPNIDIEDLLPVNPMTSISNYPSLSAQRLQAVFERVDQDPLSKNALQKKAVELPKKAAAAIKAAEEAEARGDMAAADLHHQVAKALGGHEYYDPGAAYAYGQAAKEQKKENSEAAEAYRKAALNYEAQVEALIKGDTQTAELHNLIANALGGNCFNPGAAVAYSKAAENQKKGNSEVAEAWRKSALSHEAQAEALGKGDTAAAELHDQVARALGGSYKNPGAAYAYAQTAYEQKEGNSEAAEAWRKAALSYEAKAEALSQGDTAAAKFHNQVSNALGGDYNNPGATVAYSQAAQEQEKGHREAAEAYCKAALSYEAKAEALSKSDTTTAELHEQVANALGGYEDNPGAAFAYSCAAYDQESGNSEAAEAWHKSALSYEAQAEALTKGDTVAAKLYRQVANALGGHYRDTGAAYAYWTAAKEQKKGHTKAAEAWRKAALSHESQAEALTKGDTAAAELYRQAANALEGDEYKNPGAAAAYSQAVKEQEKGNSKAAEARRKAALSYEAQAEAFSKGDTTAAELHHQVARALGGNVDNPGAAVAYSQAAQKQKKGNNEVAKVWSKAALSYEAQAEALIKGDIAAAELHHQVATALGGNEYNSGAAYAYSQVVYEQERGNSKIAKAWRKSALSYEAQAEALSKSDTAAAKFHNQVANALGGSWKNPGAAAAYSQAAKEQKKGNSKTAEIWRKAALSYEAQVEALIKGDRAAAELHHQLARLLGGDWDNPGAGFSYSKASGERSEGCFKSAEIWTKTAQDYEAKATALETEIHSMERAPKNWEEYKAVATAAFEKTFEIFKTFEREGRTSKTEAKQTKEKAQEALLEYDQPINQFPRILEKASTSVTAETPHLKAWFDQQLAEAKKIKLELHSRLIDLLDFSTGENQAVFWTGYPDGNQTLAMHFSKENNKKTLEMTSGGHFLDALNLYGKDTRVSISLADAFFDIASERFARGAMGEINAFLPSGEPRALSVFKRIEEPLLREKEQFQGLSLILHKKLQYDYWRKKDKKDESDEYKDIYEIFDEEISRLQNNHHLDQSVTDANALRHEASKALSVTFASINNAMTSPIDMALPLWEEAVNQAERTQQLWSQVTTAFERIQHQVPEILQAHLPKLLQYFRNEAASWTAEIKWRQLRHQAAMVDLCEERISKLFSTNDSHSLHLAADEEAQIMITCESAADEWIRAEGNLSQAASQAKEYNTLKTTVAANRCKIEAANKVAEAIAVLNNMIMAPKTAGKADKQKLQKTLESYADAIHEYQHYLQKVEEAAPEEWNRANGWRLIADEWKKNRKAIEELEDKIVIKMESIDVKSEETSNNRSIDRDGGGGAEETRFGNKEEKTKQVPKTTSADFLKSFQEDNQTLAHQFSKEMNKLILDMAAGNEVK